MMRLPRFLPSVVIACCSVALPVISSSVAFAQEKTPGEAPAKPAENPLKSNADAFWHYAKTFRYDLANAEAKKILEAKPDAVQALKAFQSVAADRKENVDQWMLRWQQVPELRDSVNGLLALMAQGHEQQRADQTIIEQNIKLLTGNEQTYTIAVNRLRESGELAVPEMIKYLRDPSKAQYQTPIRQAFVEMRHAALAPLVAALQMPADDQNMKALTTVISALGEIGYDVSVAPLSDLASSANSPAVIKQAAAQALIKMGAGDPASLNPAHLYYEIGQKYYYNKAATSPDVRTKVAYLWSWDQSRGLEKKDVPPAIYGDLMALRSTKRSLQLDPSRDESLALWLSADYGREVRLPQGGTDPTVTPETPKAHYYGVASGAKYLNMVITRALGDRDTGVALAAVRSIQHIGGQSNLFAGGQSGSLVSAMQYPDRIVRFEAAFAAAEALPQTAFEGQERVVPILSEAVVQTGKPHILVVVPEDQLNRRVQELKDAGYDAGGATTADAAAALSAPAIDAVLVSDDNPAEVQSMQKIVASTPRLQGAAVVIQTKTAASPFTVLPASNPMITVTQASKIEDLKTVLEQARAKAGAVPLDEKVATDYALRATQLLSTLARSRGQVLDLSGAQDALLAAVNDPRAEIAVAGGNALAFFNAKPAQQALLMKAVDDKTDAKMKLSTYNSLATSAKFFGNLLEGDQVKQLQKAVTSEPDLEVRSAAAEAHGALNLPADQVKELLLK
jgi:hypothetical protein